MVLHKVSACRDRTWDRIQYTKQFDKPFHHVSYDVWPRPWPWAHPGCRPGGEPSCASLVAIQPSACEKKQFSWNHKSVPITWPLTSTLTLSIPWMQALWGSSCASLVTIQLFACEKKRFAQSLQTDRRTDRQTDRQTDDGRRAIALAHGMS